MSRIAPAVAVVERLLSMRRVCEDVGFGESTVRRWMKDEQDPFPQPIYIGISARWSQLDVQAWIQRKKEQQERRTVAGARSKAS